MWYSRILYCRYRREMPRYSAVFSRLPPQAASAARTVSRFSAAVLRAPGRDGTATTAIMEQLNAEMEQHIKEGTSTFPAREEYRVSWDGIACWPYLSYNLRTLKQYGINMVASSYGKAWAIQYDDLDGMARAYCFASTNGDNASTMLSRRYKALTRMGCEGTVMPGISFVTSLFPQKFFPLRMPCGSSPLLCFFPAQAFDRDLIHLSADRQRKRRCSKPTHDLQVGSGAEHDASHHRCAASRRCFFTLSAHPDPQRLRYFCNKKSIENRSFRCSLELVV